MKTTILAILALVYASATLSSPIALQNELDVQPNKDISDKPNVADWLVKQEGFPQDMIDQIYTNEIKDLPQSDSLEKRQVKNKDQEVQEESAKEEAALEFNKDAEINDVKNEKDESLQKRGFNGCGCGGGCGGGFSFGHGFGAGCGRRSRICCTSRTRIIRHPICCRRFATRVFAAPIFTRIGARRRHCGRVFVVRRGCNRFAFVKQRTVSHTVKRIPLCYGLGAKRHCTMLNRFNYGGGKDFGYFGGRLGHGLEGISGFGSLSLGKHLNVGKCSVISKGLY
jgi:hypothetical protein